MRTQLEVDPFVGLRGLDAIMPLIEEYKWAIDLEICVFPEEPLFDLEGTEALVVEALDRGCQVLGANPGVDSEPLRQIDWVFERAKEYDVDIDMHLDADENPEGILVEYVCDKVVEYGYQGRVAVAHLNKQTAIPEPRLFEIARRMADAGVAATVLPTTDLYLGGRDLDHKITRGVLQLQKLLPFGVNASLSTNNFNNAITPVMHGSPLYQANLFAMAAQVWKREDFDACFEMVTRRAARILRRDDYGIKVGNPADLVILDCHSRREAVCAIAPILYSFKGGRMITRNLGAEFLKPF
jgi:cytosine/creatinine deaminase